MEKLFSPYKLGNLELKNRVVMSPMTRCRALHNIPNDLIATYYGQRAGAGLIVTEGTSPSPNGLGYARIPGIFSEAQVAGWKKTTDAVHRQGGRIFVQFMHTGRMGHPLNLPEGAELVAPSAIAAPGQMWTDSQGMVDMPVPRAMTGEDLVNTKKEFMRAALNAVEAGFDGVELHGANGYLLEQFLSPVSNQRTDEYGGSVENRCRFALEVTAAVGQAIGMEKVAIRLSPYGVNGGMKPYPEIAETYTYLAGKLDSLGIQYVHVVDHSSMGAPEVPVSIKMTIREKLKNTEILAGGYSKETAERDLQSGLADLIAFGRPFINNPDLVERMKNNWPIDTNWDPATFYSADEKGYTDFPTYQAG
ncbi:MAG TPA: alkene reductase [Bacteroidales bacterium]|nr:alkene reductase [Bacteroidales bacterium]